MAYVSRLSGSTAEFISLWNQTLFEKAPFGCDGEGLYLRLTLAIPSVLLPSDGELMGIFLGNNSVHFHAGNLKELFPGSYHVTGYQLTFGNQRL